MASIKELVFSLKTSFLWRDFRIVVDKLEARESHNREAYETLKLEHKRRVAKLEDENKVLKAEKRKLQLEVSGLKEELQGRNVESKAENSVGVEFKAKYEELLKKLNELKEENVKIEGELEVLKVDRAKDEMRVSILKEELKKKEEEEETHYKELFAISDGLALEKKIFETQARELEASYSSRIEALEEKCKRDDDLKRNYLSKIEELETERRESESLLVKLKTKMNTADEKHADLRRIEEMWLKSSHERLRKQKEEYKKCGEGFSLVEGERTKSKAELEEMRRKFLELDDNFRKLEIVEDFLQMRDKAMEDADDHDEVQNSFKGEIRGDIVDRNSNTNEKQVSSSFMGFGFGVKGTTKVPPIQAPSSSYKGAEIRDGDTTCISSSQVSSSPARVRMFRIHGNPTHIDSDYLQKIPKNVEPSMHNKSNPPVVDTAPPEAVNNMNTEVIDLILRNSGNKESSFPVTNPALLESAVNKNREHQHMCDEGLKNNYATPRHYIEEHGDTMDANLVNASEDITPDSHRVPPMAVQTDKFSNGASLLNRKEAISHESIGVPSPKRIRLSLLDRNDGLENFSSRGAKTEIVGSPHERNARFESVNLETQGCQRIGRPLLDAANELEGDFGYDVGTLEDGDRDVDHLHSDVLVAPLEWRFEADMLSSLDNDDELCLKGFCALYRRHIVPLPPRYSSLGMFLTDRDPARVLKKSVEEVRRHNPSGIEYCRHICIEYCRNLFDIYLKGKDQHFP